MVTQDTGGVGCPGPTRYVLRQRERFWFWTCIVAFAFPVPFLTLATFGWVTGYSSVAEVIYFGLFFLLMVGCGIGMLRERAAVAGQVLLVAGDAGVYLADPPRHIPWAEVAGLVAFRTWQDGDDGDAGKWLSRLVVVRPGEDCLPGAVARQLSSPDRWGAVAELRNEKLRLRDLAAAVHTCAPGLPVWDAGQIKSKSVKGQGQAGGQVGDQAGSATP
jgi:hypothetical protein